MEYIRRKIISIFVITLLLFGQVGFPLVVYAELPSAPEAPSTPEVPDSPDTPDKPETPPSSDESSEPQPEPSPTIETPESPELPQSSPSPSSWDDVEEDDEYAGDGDETPDESLAESSSPPQGSYSGDNWVGDPKIETGDADASGTIINTGNNNLLDSGYPYPNSSGGISIINEGNGTDSENSGSVVIDDTENTTQTNDAGLDNSLVVDSDTGNNSASRNVGSTTIDTGDANVSGTIVNSVNTNVDGVMVAEFNVADDHIGDLILDYDAFCISGCGGSSLSIINEDNGSDSENTGTIDTDQTNNTTQDNIANIENELILTANSGDNIANDNTGGDSFIETGDANVSGNVVNFANNNLAGNVIYGVVNIFGNLIGDIILPESYFQGLAQYGTDATLANIGNGTGSDNTTNLDTDITNNFTQVNDATILNNLTFDATTGGNTTSDNTGGDNKIETGDASIDATVVNVANTNIIGGTWWIVLINEAGNWFGKILGNPQGGNFAASSGTDFLVNPDGTISITNEGNGSDSTNTGDVNQDITNNVTQTNDATVTNNIALSANTGENSASRNTGGDSKISTGDANIMLNLVNFVNNNFAGGNVVFTVVNVFGSWLGNFVTPGTQAQSNATANSQPQGGSNPGDTSGSNNSNSGGNSSGGSSNSNSGGQANSNSSSGGGPTVATNIPFVGAFFNSLNQGSGNAQVAGFSTVVANPLSDNTSLEGGSKKLRINLAWLVIILPLLLGGVFAVRKFKNMAHTA